MRKWNKLLALVLAMVMVFGLTATAFAEEDKNEGEPTPISDSTPANGETTPDDSEPADAEPAAEPDLTDVEDWAKEYVSAIVKQGLMDMSETGFRPEDKTTRVELVVALYRLENAPSVEGKENKFEDIASLTEEQQAAIVWAASEGIVNGEEETIFNPNGNVERQQIAKILFVYAKAEAVEEDKLASFADKDEVEEYAVDFINWLVAMGIMNGDDGLLKPAGDATRVQVATMLSRYITDVLSVEPAEGEDENKTETTDPAEGEDENKTEATDPAEGEDENKTETTDPAEGEDENKTETTDPAEGEGENDSTSDPDETEGDKE
ncbi:MAG: S-layer homology domain-containing protein [Oscillospiraceae bacterium]|nr:S-layer homology domain-containing protein [Oscillospiraceae bacterium]